MTRIILAALALVAITACGGRSGTLTLNLVTSPGDDPFVDAATVRFSVGANKEHVDTVPVSMGHFSYKVSFKPIGAPGPVLVEALDATGNIVAHGSSAYVLLDAVDEGPIAIWVGRPGRTAPAQAALPKAIAETASANINGLGILYAGGRDATGTVLADTSVYDVFTQAVITTAPMQKPRAGAAAAQVSNVHAVVYGGATSTGFGTFSTIEPSIELFDPTVGVGVWASLPIDTFPGRAYPDVTVLSSGGIIVSGGVDASGTAQNTAGLINPDGAIKLSTLSSPMAAGRVGHAMAPCKFPDGDGALLFGGLPPGTTGQPVAERLNGQAFSAYDVGTQENRVDATATLMPSGDVLVLGGTTAAGAQASGLVISRTLPSATVTPLPAALSVARSQHTAALSGADLVVCGGVDASGTVQATCDVLDSMTYARKSTIPMATGRRGHRADVMETGIIVMAAGFGADGAPLGSIEIYTP
jgi:hypothetical protein